MKTQLNEDYAVSIGKRLKDILSLDKLTPESLNSLVERDTHSGKIYIHYTLVNPLEVA